MKWEIAKEIFSSEWLKKLWNSIEIQALVVTSLVLQFTLAFQGSRRKHNSGLPTRFIVWFCYLLSTWVTTVALGKLTEANSGSLALTTISYGNNPKVEISNNQLRAIWAPLLLMHIGGPHSITAYAVEDSRLGLRQILELGVQLGVVLLIVVKSWNNSWLSIIILTLLLGGVIRSVERVWAFKRSTETEAIFHTLSDGRVLEFLNPWVLKSSIPHLPLLVKAYKRFENLKPHLQNWIGHPLSINLPSMSTLYHLPQDVFRITEFELGFMYDVLYTKAPISYSMAGFLCRSICFISLVSSLFGFTILFRTAKVELSRDSNRLRNNTADVKILAVLLSSKYNRRIDISITYLLLAGAVLLELHSFVNLISSDWTILYVIKEDKYLSLKRILQALVPYAPRRTLGWSNRMEQMNLLDYSLRERSKISKILSTIGRNENVKRWVEKFHRYKFATDVEVPANLKKLIVEQIEEVRGQRVWQPFNKRGEWTLERFKCLDDFKWSIETDYTNEANQQTSFGRAITVWHIATDVCYNEESSGEGNEDREMCKYLSDYMMHLLAQRPHILSIGTKNILFEGACEKVALFWQKTKKDGEPESSSPNEVTGPPPTLEKEPEPVGPNQVPGGPPPTVDEEPKSTGPPPPMQVKEPKSMGTNDEPTKEQAALAGTARVSAPNERPSTSEITGEATPRVNNEEPTIRRRKKQPPPPTPTPTPNKKPALRRTKHQAEQKRDITTDFTRALLKSRPEETLTGQFSNDKEGVFLLNTEIISSWELVLEGKLLAELLLDREDRWCLMNSIWVEMLCYAASNCPWVYHAERLRLGGGLITHVWLLLNHETNKFNISIY